MGNKSLWPRFVTVVLNSDEVDYIDEALEMLANYHDIKRADDISERLVAAWNNAEPLSPAREIRLTAERRRKQKEKNSGS